MLQQSEILFFEQNNDENRVVLPDSVSQQCETYAKQRMENDADWYKRNRGGFKPGIFEGWAYKCAESAVSRFLTSQFGFPVVEPDFNIYKRGQKSWAADLIHKDVKFLDKSFGEFRVGVKSANRAQINRGYAESFLFQCNDKLFTEGNGDDWLFFVYVPHLQPTLKSAEFYIRGIASYPYLRSNDLFQPTQKTFDPPKYAVYTEQLRRSIRIPAAA